jgi:aryl carrier-like protein
MDAKPLEAALGLRDGQVIVHSFVAGVRPANHSETEPLDYLAQTRLTASSLRAFLQRELPPYMVPASIVFLDRLPVTANGKIDRAALPDAAEARRSTETIDTDPEVKWLSEIVSELLAGASVDPHATFFELGATSLHLIQLSRRLQAEGKSIAITELFRSPSIVALARHLASAETASVREAALSRGRSKRISRRAKETGELR